jgi:hypothetical protein
MSNQRISRNQFSVKKSRGALVAAETVARRKREGRNFKKLPQTQQGVPNTTAGYTVDREGLLNNYAIEPEMYINEPGDLRGNYK